MIKKSHLQAENNEGESERAWMFKKAQDKWSSLLLHGDGGTFPGIKATNNRKTENYFLLQLVKNSRSTSS